MARHLPGPADLLVTNMCLVCHSPHHIPDEEGTCPLGREWSRGGTPLILATLGPLSCPEPPVYSPCCPLHHPTFNLNPGFLPQIY